MAKDKLKSESTSSRPRDEKGHFISLPDIKSAKNPLEKFLISHTGNYKDEEDLLDIRIGNPLRRVIALLEEIKRQKAFSFSLKGSLGLAGVVLAISLFGIFGGGRMICDKGTQSLVGTVRVLNEREIYSKPVPLITYLLELVASPQKQIKNRMILIKNDLETVYLPFSEELDISKFSNLPVIATGNYNSCLHELTVIDKDSIETFVK